VKRWLGNLGRGEAWMRGKVCFMLNELVLSRPYARFMYLCKSGSFYEPEEQVNAYLRAAS
jgi:hypothetical protein